MGRNKSGRRSNWRSIWGRAMLILAAILLPALVVLAWQMYAGATATVVVTDRYTRQNEQRSMQRQASFAGEGPNDFEALRAILREARAANDWMFDQRADNDHDVFGPWSVPSLEPLFMVPSEGTREQHQRARQRALEHLAEWEQRGVFDRSAELATLGPIARPPTDEAMDNIMLDGMGVSRGLARALAARAFVAAERGDHDAALDSVEQMMVLGRQVAWLGYLIDWLMGLAIQTMARETLLDAMRTHPGYDDAWLVRADELIQRELIERMPTLADALDGERLFADDVMQRCFSDNGRGGGRFLPLQYARLYESDFHDPGWIMRPLGDTRLSNFHGVLFYGRGASQRWLDDLFDRYRRSVDAMGERALEIDREIGQHLERASWRNPMAESVLHFGMVRSVERTRRIAAAGARVLLAIERYRLRHGTIPPTLEALSDLLPEALRTDPFTGQAWDYQRQPMSTDRTGERLRAGSLAWPYTLRSRSMAGYSSRPPEDRGLDPKAGVLITVPIQGPRYDLAPDGDN